MVGLNMDGPARDRVLKLMEEKDRIEREIRDHTAVLETNNVGMRDSLVDQNGYPRSDVDVYQVRNARHRIICLQNDHKAIMKRIEQGLAEVHSSLLGSSMECSSSTNVPTYTNGHSNGHANRSHSENTPEGSYECFAKIGSVQNGSPADVAGLTEGDDVLQFGSINHRNFVDLTQINQVVAHSVRQRINVQVKRQGSILNLTVIPQPWAQPGLLGCQIRRINS